MLYLFGGNANNGVIDGVFYANLNNPFSNVNANIATGLSCVCFYTLIQTPHHLVKN